MWIQRYPELQVGFAERTKDLATISNEAIEFLLQSGLIQLTNNAELEISRIIRPLSKTIFANDEVKECIVKGEHVAKWFAGAGKVETIYISLGVRP